MRSLVKMNLVKEISVANGKVDVTLTNAALMKSAQDWLKDRVAEAATGLDGVKEVNISYVEVKPKELNSISNVERYSSEAYNAFAQKLTDILVNKRI